MAERLFYIALLLMSAVYLYFAFFVISAPIQYDPLGPESWPRILGSLIVVCLIIRLIWPTDTQFRVARPTAIRLSAIVFLMILYALFFEALGFLLSTWAFCAAVTLILGARPIRAFLFGAVVSIVTFYGFTDLLDLNLPSGMLAFIELR